MITKSDLIRTTSKRIKGISQADMKIVIEEFFETILDYLKEGEEVQLANFGVFKVSNRNPETKVTPTGQVANIPARKNPIFKFYKKIKDEFNEEVM